MSRDLYDVLLNLKALHLITLLMCFNGNSQRIEYNTKLSKYYDATYLSHLYGANSVSAIKTNNNIMQINNTDHNSTKVVRVDYLNESLMLQRNLSNDFHGWKCFCWNGSYEVKVECRCEGEGLTRIPQTLGNLIQRLTIVSAGLKRLRNTGLKTYGSTLYDIEIIDMKRLETIEDEAFGNLTQLRTIYISHAPKLTYLSKEVFRHISNTIQFIRIINTNLIRIPNLMYLQSNNVLQMLDFDNNRIIRIDSNSINIKTEQLILGNNEISYIEESAFYGSQIAFLTLKGNLQLQEIHPNAFQGSCIQKLDLSSTSLIHLPSIGLDDIEVLRIENTHSLKTIPSVYYFRSLRKAYLTHSFHCCAFKFPSRHDPQRFAQRLQEIKNWQLECKRNKKDAENFHTYEHTYGLWDLMNGQDDVDYAGNSLDMDIGIFHDTIDTDIDQLEEYCGNFTFKKQDVECYPAPNALNPCEDVIGYYWLRIIIWVVVGLALLGNLSVLIVIFPVRSTSSSVSRFLIAHLAFADFCLGLYLLFIASIDIYSLGKYFNFAYDWQYGAGCKVAGFLTVFASHLSVFALTVITIERWMAITHALYLDFRIKLRQAVHIMIVGFLYSIIMATLPLFGISNYSSTSICLPMENSDSYDTVYLVAIIAVNGMGFFIIGLCYIHIYMSLDKKTRQGRRTSTGEMTLAKKISLLVFINFACWAPIAFFSLTALAGYPLINVTKAKILLVLFYPLNSCADPYLYAFITQQYRQDFCRLLARFGFYRQRNYIWKGNYNIDLAYFTQRPNSLNNVKNCQPILLMETELI